jgi:hypothetical protein
MDAATRQRLRNVMQSEPAPHDHEWLAEWQWMVETLVAYGLAEPIYEGGALVACTLTEDDDGP